MTDWTMMVAVVAAWDILRTFAVVMFTALVHGEEAEARR